MCEKKDPNSSFWLSLTLLFPFFVIAFAGCKKSANLPGFTSGVNVYMAGQDNGNAVYWKNGQKVVLASGGVANSIAVSGTDVYVCGLVYKGFNQLAVYWKNGTQFNLNDTGVAGAKQILVSGTDIYIAGNIFSAGPKVNAVYWKNGNRVDLAPYSNGQALGIAVSGSDIYVIGETWKDFDTAVLWKNGVFQNIYAINAGLFASISFFGPDLYIVGVKAYLKNGNPVGIQNANYVSSVTVAGQDVYVAGSTISTNGKIDAAYWKNGVITTLTNNQGSNTSGALGIAVAGQDIYTVGGIYDNAKHSAVYWKNKDQVILSSSGIINAIAIGN